MTGQSTALQDFLESLQRITLKIQETVEEVKYEDLSYYSTLSEDFSSLHKKCLSQLVQTAESVSNHSKLDNLAIKFRLDLDELSEDFDDFVEYNDDCLEKIDTLLDKVTGKYGNSLETQAVNSTQSSPVVTEINSNGQITKVIHAQNISRPQLKFKDHIDNSGTPFVSKIHEKYHAIVPLKSKEQGIHPYEHELMNLQYDSSLFEPCLEQMFIEVGLTPLEYIDNIDSLLVLISELQNESSIAIDLENHSFRSYQGFTCLMQISSRTKDYIIDTLELRNDLHLLNQIFANPSIVKVLHGAESDIMWLQRDLGLYIVNMFDTFFASKVLEMAGNSLAFLVKHYCGKVLDKQYQLADWRIRPLTEEMKYYAREDTHYLLYIFDRMRNDILKYSTQISHLHNVFRKSRDLCLQTYSTSPYDPDSWRSLSLKFKTPFNKVQLTVFKDLHKWRDHIARDEDESIGYVMANRVLYKLSSTLPDTADKVLLCCNPVPPYIRQYATDIALMIGKTVKNKTTLPEIEPLKATHTIFDKDARLDENQMATENEKDATKDTTMEDSESIAEEVSQSLNPEIVTPRVGFARISSPSSLCSFFDEEVSQSSTPVDQDFQISLITATDIPEPIHIAETKLEKRKLVDSPVAQMKAVTISKVGQKDGGYQDLRKITESTKLDLSKVPTKRQRTVDFVPFDYSTAESNIDLRPVEEQAEKYQKSTAFQPVKEIGKKKRSALPVKPKSGNRSMTFNTKK